MLRLALVFLIVALIAGVPGLTGIAGLYTNFAWIRFVVGLMPALVMFIVDCRSHYPASRLYGRNSGAVRVRLRTSKVGKSITIIETTRRFLAVFAHFSVGMDVAPFSCTGNKYCVKEN